MKASVKATIWLLWYLFVFVFLRLYFTYSYQRKRFLYPLLLLFFPEVLLPLPAVWKGSVYLATHTEDRSVLAFSLFNALLTTKIPIMPETADPWPLQNTNSCNDVGSIVGGDADHFLHSYSPCLQSILEFFSEHGCGMTLWCKSPVFWNIVGGYRHIGRHVNARPHVSS